MELVGDGEGMLAFDAESGYTLVNGVQSIFYEAVKIQRLKRGASQGLRSKPSDH